MGMSIASMRCIPSLASSPRRTSKGVTQSSIRFRAIPKIRRKVSRMPNIIFSVTTREESGGEQYIEPYALLPKEYKSRVWQTLQVNYRANHKVIPKVIDRVIHRRGKNDKG